MNPFLEIEKYMLHSMFKALKETTIESFLEIYLVYIFVI